MEQSNSLPEPEPVGHVAAIIQNPIDQLDLRSVQQDAQQEAMRRLNDVARSQGMRMVIERQRGCVQLAYVDLSIKVVAGLSAGFLFAAICSWVSSRGE